MLTTTKYEFPKGWHQVDTSGDGGDSGYHLLLLFGGKMAVTIGASGGDNVLGDFSRDVTSYENPTICLCFHHLDGYPFMTVDDFVEYDAMSDTNKHEMFFRSMREALDFLNWVPMFILA